MNTKPNKTNEIKNHLKTRPSYLKWGVKRLADEFGCSVKTMTEIVQSLAKVKANYLNRFQN